MGTPLDSFHFYHKLNNKALKREKAKYWRHYVILLYFKFKNTMGETIFCFEVHSLNMKHWIDLKKKKNSSPWKECNFACKMIASSMKVQVKNTYMYIFISIFNTRLKYKIDIWILCIPAHKKTWNNKDHLQLKLDWRYR